MYKPKLFLSEYDHIFERIFYRVLSIEYDTLLAESKRRKILELNDRSRQPDIFETALYSAVVVSLRERHHCKNVQIRQPN